MKRSQEFLNFRHMKICADSLLRVPEFQLPASLKEGRYHAANFRLTDYVTISDAIQAVCEYQSKNVKVVLDHNTQQQSSFLADFGVALRCNMIHVRGSIGLSQQNVLKRLQSIETESMGGGSKKKDEATSKDSKEAAGAGTKQEKIKSGADSDASTGPGSKRSS